MQKTEYEFLEGGRKEGKMNGEQEILHKGNGRGRTSGSGERDGFDLGETLQERIQISRLLQGASSRNPIPMPACAGLTGDGLR